MAHYEPQQIHSYKEYEEFWERVKKTPEYYHSWDIEFEWNLTLEDADDPRVRELFGDNVCILDNLKKYYQKAIRFKAPADKLYILTGTQITEASSDKLLYILTGVQITNEDFYYIVKPYESDNSISYITCLCQIVPVE